MRLFKSDWVDRVLQVLKIPDDVPIENKRVTSAIANAQGQVESQNFESRKNVLKYDDVMDRQRKVIYGERREVLEGADLEEQIRGFLDDIVDGYVSGATEGFAEEWDLDELWTALARSTRSSRRPATSSRRRPAAATASTARSSSRRSRTTPTRRTTAARPRSATRSCASSSAACVLSVLDRKWREHLYEMDYLREGICLRAYSQRDPLVEYQREGFDMFAAMMDGIKEESVGFLFNLEVQVEEEDEDEVEEEVEDEVVEPMRQPVRRRPTRTARRRTSGPRAWSGRASRRTCPTPRPARTGEVDGARRHTTRQQRRRPFAGVGRNAKCPCGSGKKFKKCHGAPGGPTGLTARING